MADSTPVPLCRLCKEVFDALPPCDRWEPSEEVRLLRASPNSRWKYGTEFKHHGTPEELLQSAESCPLCRLIIDLFNLPDDDLRGTTGLRLSPWHGRASGYPQTHGIQAAFTIKAPDGGNHPGPTRLLRASRILPYTHPVSEKEDIYYERDVPESPMSQEGLDTIRFWFRDCVENHPQCHPAGRSTILPTRVIDIGNLADDTPVIHTSRGEEAPYVALSYCWGESLPLRTTTSTLEAYQGGLPMHQMPHNFLDAIRVARLVGIRYLWIDALCIVQDDPADWAAEAKQMTDVYRNSALTISALNSRDPEAGFLGPRAQKPLTFAHHGVAIHSFRQGFSDAMENSILSTRAWCMQERLLSPVILHFGRDQMYWECCTTTSEENRGCAPCNQGGPSNRPSQLTFMSWNHRTEDFNMARKRFHVYGPNHCWNISVEEYSHRDLTFRSDKLVAIAGIANLVRPAMGNSSYIAGHFVGGTCDLLTSLFWSARLIIGGIRKAPGFDNIAVLGRPDSNYPSWSWASVDGAVQFHGDHVQEKDGIEILDVKLHAGADDVMAKRVDASLVMRAPIAKLRYKPDIKPEWSQEFVGSIFPVGHTAAMDVDRAQERDCWVLPAASIGSVLVLDEVKPNIFCRIGWALFDSPMPWHPEVEYCTREFELI